MRTTPLATGEFYHIFNRGTEKRQTFIDDDDYAQFLSTLLLKNKKYVSFSAYTIMPNHYHFLLRQECDDGISKFLQRALTSYTRYFNRREVREGRLWTTQFKAKHIDSDAYLQIALNYIHRNVADLAPQKADAVAFAREYPWSSYRHYAGLTHDPLVSLPLQDLFDPEFTDRS